MAEVKTYRVDLPDGRFVNVQSDKELTEDQIRQVQEMAPSAEPQRGVLEGLLTGAATGVAPSAAFLKTLGTVGRATAGAGPMVSIPSSLLAGIAAAAVTGIGQRKAIEAISPETAKRIEETAAQQPLATMIGSAVTSGFKPGPALAETQLGRFAERAVPAALGGGIQLGTELMEGEGGQLPEGAVPRIFTAAGINALANRETALAQRIIGPIRPPVRPPELPKVKPPTPVTDNLGQVKAGESLPSATAKANQMATEGGTAVPSPTEQLKQQTAATEAQTRAAQKDAETAQAEAAKAQQAALELEQKFNEQEDLVVELQRLTGKPRDAIVALIPEGEIDPRLDFLRSEVGYNTLVAELQGITGTSYGTITKLFPKGKGNSGIKALQQEIAYRRNPLVADADRRIKELEAQVGGIERRGARQREEAIATGEAQRAMEETTGRALAPEVAVPSALEAPEAAMGEIPGFRERPAMVTPERNVEVQIGEQNRFNREKRALEEKAIGIQEELSKKGVNILIEQARVLAALAKENPAEYNYTKQRIIDAVVPEVQGPPVRRPTRLTALEALTPEAVGIEAPAPAPAPVPAPAPIAPRAARRAPRAMAEAPVPVPEVVLTERVTAPEAPAPAPVVAPETRTDLTAAIQRRNVEPSGKLVNGKEATPEAVAEAVTSAEARLQDYETRIKKLQAAEKANPNADVPTVRSFLERDSRATTFGEAIANEQRLARDARQYIEDVKTAGRAYAERTGQASVPVVSTASKSSDVPELIQKQLNQINFTARRLTGENRGKLTKKILIDPTGKVYNVDDSVGHPAYIKEFLPEYVKNGKPDVARMVKDGWYWGSVSKDNAGNYQFIDGATTGWGPTKPVPSALRSASAETPIPAVSRAPEAPAAPALTPEAQVPVKPTEKAITEAPPAQPRKWKRVSDFWGKTIGEFLDESNAQRNNLPKNIANAWEDLTHLFNRSKAMQGKRVRAEQLGIDPTSESGRIALDKAQELGVIKGLGENRKQFTFDKVRYSNVGEVLPISIYPEYFKEPIKPVEPQAIAPKPEIAPAPKAQMPVKSIEKAQDRAVTEEMNNLAERISSSGEPVTYSEVSDKLTVKEWKQVLKEARESQLDNVNDTVNLEKALTPAEGKEAAKKINDRFDKVISEYDRSVVAERTKLEQPASGLTKEEQGINDKIEQTIEALDLARANLEPTSKIVSILKRSKLLTEGEIKLVQGAGKSMGPEDAATEAMSLLEFKKAEAKPVEAKAEVAAQTPDEVAAVKAIETGSVAPEAPAPTPAPATAGSLVPEAPPAPAPTTKANRLAQIKERFKQTNAGMTPRGTKAAVQEVAAEATLATPAEVPTAEPIQATAPQERFSQTKGQVYDKSYSFYKKSSEQFSPWFAEIGGKEYPLTLKSGDPILSIGMAKTEAKRLAAEKLRPSGEELGFRAFMRMPSPGEPLAGAAIGYAIGDTEEERRQNAILGFQLGSLVSLGGVALGRRSANLAKLATNASLSDKGDFDIRTITRAELNAVPAVKNAQGQLIAPNGKPSNLSEFQWKAVRTDRFKNWFGDWQKDPANASKVVDANGEPLPVYHGTRNVFEGFDRANSSEETRSAATFYDIMSEFGDNFATSPEVASRFAEDVYKNSPKPGSPNVQKVFLNIRNLDNVGSEVEFKSQILTRKSNSRTVEEILVNEAAPEEVLVAMPGEEILTAQERINKYETDPDFRASINQEAINQERNFDEPSSETIDGLVRDWKRENPNVDGILYINEAEKETRGIADKRAFITFKPEQVKSVWNRGTWSPDDINTLRAANVWWSRKPKTVTQKEINEMPVSRAANDRDGFISQLMAYTKADSQSVYDKMVADNKINNTGVPSAQVAQDIAKAPVHHQRMLSDLASAFPMITKIPGGQAISNAIGTFAKGVERQLGVIVSNIASRSPRAAGAINTYFYEKGKQQVALWANGGEALNDFTKTKLLKEQSEDFWRLARNGDVEGAKAILRTTEGGEEAVRNYDLVLEQRRMIREEAKANGIPMGDIGDALPSIVADVDGLLKYLGVEERGRYGKMLEAARKAKADRVIKAAEETGVEPPDRSTIALNSDEEVLVMSNYLTGIRNTTGKPGFLKGRSIETVDKEMDQFYAPGSVALKRYYDRWVDYKLNKQLFGKVRPDLTPNEPIGGNIAKILAEDMKTEGLDREGLERVQEAIRSLFHFDYKATNSLADKARKIQTFAMLSDISTAVIQFADLFTMAYAYGGPKGVINAFKPGKRVTLRDINLLENPNADIDDITKGIQKPGGKIGKVVTAAYEFPLKYLLGAADKINKEGLLNAAKSDIANVVQNPETRKFRELEAYYSRMYPERWPAMLEDLRKPEFREGKLTDNTAFFLRNELAKFQPIDLAGRAEGYVAASPGFKLMYTLRSYAIKQLDIIRRDVYDNLKMANQTGEAKYAAKAIANMAAYTALVGAGQQLFRYGMDEALGRKIEDPKEYAIQGAMGIMLIPRYSIYRFGEQGLFVAGAEWLVPGSGILNDLQQDVKTTGKYLGGQVDVRGFRTVPNISTLFKQAEAVKFVPGIGKELYWMAGKGAEKSAKAKQDEAMGKTKPSTLETLFRAFFPADTKTEMKP